MQKTHCSACSTEWNKLKKRQSCGTERTGFSESRNTDLVHVSVFHWYVVLCCYHCACLCQVPEKACVCVCIFWGRNIDILIYCDLLVKSEHFDENCCSYLEQFCKQLKAPDCSLKGIWRSCLIHNTANGVWFVKRNLTQFVNILISVALVWKGNYPFQPRKWLFLFAVMPIVFSHGPPK